MELFTLLVGLPEADIIKPLGTPSREPWGNTTMVYIMVFTESYRPFYALLQHSSVFSNLETITQWSRMHDHRARHSQNTQQRSVDIEVNVASPELSFRFTEKCHGNVRTG